MSKTSFPSIAAALALAGGVDQAQISNVTLFGLMDLSVGQTKAPGGHGYALGIRHRF